MASNSLIHPWDRLSQIAPTNNLEQGRFFISIEEFEERLNIICNDICRIRCFCKFAADNFKKIQERRLICGDIKLFVDYISIFIKKDFVDMWRYWPFVDYISVFIKKDFADSESIFDLCRE